MKQPSYMEARGILAKPKRSKYGVDMSPAAQAARTVMHHGKPVKCASKAEAKRFGELILLERGKRIFNLTFHPKYGLYAWSDDPSVAVKVVVHYIGDAGYDEFDKGGEFHHVVEDIKGVETEAFKIKAKWFRACYPHIDFRVLKARA